MHIWGAGGGHFLINFHISSQNPNQQACLVLIRSLVLFRPTPVIYNLLFVSLMKTWDLAKKSHFASVLSTDAVNANFLHTMMIYIEKGTHGQILNFSVKYIFQLTQSTTVKMLY